MNVICNASNPKAFAASIAGDGGKVAMECRSHRRIKDGRTVFGAEKRHEQEHKRGIATSEEDQSGMQPLEIAWDLRKPRPMALGCDDPASSVLSSD
jgi:hypothetical protein